jgi:hypothetical protein
MSEPKLRAPGWACYWARLEYNPRRHEQEEGEA